VTGAGTLVFTSDDVSLGGAFLRSELLLEQGDALALTIDVPGTGELRAQARVVWVRRFPEGGQPSGMGVEFLALAEPTRSALATWLAS
jgi:Tfp pilus assembly protein PilZ